MPHAMDAAGEIDPSRRALAACLELLETWGCRPIGRPQRLGGEQRQDIGEDQLLMLLLVVDAKLDQLRHRRMRARHARLEDGVQRIIDMARDSPALPRGSGG